MGRAIPLHIRRKVVEQHALGKTCKDLSTTYGISYKSALRICKAYQENGAEGLAAHYSNCGLKGHRFAPIIYRSICWLKYLHRKWGAAYILLQLEKRHGDRYKLPSERTVQLWFKEKGYSCSKLKNHPPKYSALKASFVHDVWQIDAKEKVTIGNGDHICWLTITDEYSCSLIEVPIFSHRKDQSASVA